MVPGPFQGVAGYPGGRYSPPGGDIEGVGMSRGVGTRPQGLGMSRVVGTHPLGVGMSWGGYYEIVNKRAVRILLECFLVFRGISES